MIKVSQKKRGDRSMVDMLTPEEGSGEYFDDLLQIMLGEVPQLLRLWTWKDDGKQIQDNIKLGIVFDLLEHLHKYYKAQLANHVDRPGREKIQKAPVKELTQKQILGLIPAQAIIDYDRAKDVMQKVFESQRDADYEYYLALFPDVEEIRRQKEREMIAEGWRLSVPFRKEE